MTIKQCVVLLVAILIGSYASASIDKYTSATLQPINTPQPPFSDESLLDIGIPTLDPGLELTNDKDTVLPEVRYAESVFIANKIAKTLENSAAWGSVRVIANNDVVVDVYLNAVILQSDGETMKLNVSVSDSSGKTWYQKRYKLVVGKYTYDRRTRRLHDPFQNLYTEISNDLLEKRKKIKEKRIAELKTISKLRFAKAFAPEAFSGYMSRSKNGVYKIERLPAENDSILERVERIRDKDYLYIDTMQDYYDRFGTRMETSYQNWRKGSYDYVVKARQMDEKARRKIWGGVLAIAAGIYGRNTAGNGLERDAGTLTASSGGVLIKSGLDDKNRAAGYRESLSEMGASLSAVLEPQVIELDDQTITLTGTVDNQYEQWKKLLSQIYHAERGSTPVQDVSDTQP
jgi:hypothetical protein